MRFNPKLSNGNNNNEWVITCPICNRDKLVVNIEKKLWHCWVCQEYGRNEYGKRVPIKGAGNIVHLVMLLDKVTYQVARQFVKENVDISFKGFTYGGQSNDISVKEKEIPYPPYSKMITGILPYCYKRGITIEDVNYFGLFYCDGGRYRNRLMFPVHEEGKLIFYQGRAMWDPLPGEVYLKSLNHPKDSGVAGTEDVLFNLEKASQWGRVIITEGPIDAIHVGYNAVCTFGKHITEKQIMKLCQYNVRNIDLMWDGPSEMEPFGATKEMISVAPLLGGIFNTRVVFLPYGDPGDYSRNDLAGIIESCSIPSNNISTLGVL
jgi:DNA primase